MKKAILISTILAMAIIGCGNGAKDSADSSTSTSAVSTSNESTENSSESVEPESSADTTEGDNSAEVGGETALEETEETTGKSTSNYILPTSTMPPACLSAGSTFDAYFATGYLGERMKYSGIPSLDDWELNERDDALVYMDGNGIILIFGKNELDNVSFITLDLDPTTATEDEKDRFAVMAYILAEYYESNYEEAFRSFASTGWYQGENAAFEYTENDISWKLMTYVL